MHTLTKVFVSGALFSGECKLLLIRRLDGVWELPSGPLEFGEEPEVGVARVFAELTGIDVAPDRSIGAWSVLDADGETRIHAVHVGYLVTLTGTLLGVELDIEKHGAFAWVNANELAPRIESPPMRRACERAFVALARPRKK